jgi:hypothetical protein
VLGLPSRAQDHKLGGQASIGIEIASEGALLERGEKFYAFGRLTECTQYSGPVYDVCDQNSLSSLTTVSESAKLWRDYRYFAQYTPAALASVLALVDDLLTRFSIPRETPSNHVDFNLPAYTNYKGVLTHCQLRSDKSDVHPGFAWEQLIATCRLEQTTNTDSKMLVASVPGARAKIG